MKMERIAYGGGSNCVRFGNEQIELVAATDAGPRVIRFGFVGGPNLWSAHRAEVAENETSIDPSVLPLVQAGGFVNA